MRVSIKPHQLPIIDVICKLVLTFIYCNWGGQRWAYRLTTIDNEDRSISKSEIVTKFDLSGPPALEYSSTHACLPAYLVTLGKVS